MEQSIEPKDETVFTQKHERTKPGKQEEFLELRNLHSKTNINGNADDICEEMFSEICWSAMSVLGDNISQPIRNSKARFESEMQENETSPLLDVLANSEREEIHTYDRHHIDDFDNTAKAGVLFTGEKAKHVLIQLAKRESSGPKEAITLRMLSNAFSPELTMQQHRYYSITIHEYLKGGVSITDLRLAGLAETYADLRDGLKFDPLALAIDDRLFSAVQFRTFYKRDYKQLLVDFGCSPHDMLIRIGFGPSTLVNLDANWDVLTRWDWEAIFREKGISAERLNKSMSAHTLNMRQRMTKKMFLQANKKYKHSLLSWVTYMDLDIHKLRSLNIKCSEVANVWGYASARDPDMLEVLNLPANYSDGSKTSVSQVNIGEQHATDQGFFERIFDFFGSTVEAREDGIPGETKDFPHKARTNHRSESPARQRPRREPPKQSRSKRGGLRIQKIDSKSEGVRINRKKK